MRGNSHQLIGVEKDKKICYLDWMNESSIYTEKLFSYGTLQYESVQLATFGRKLQGSADFLPGFRMTMIDITDSDVIAKSGQDKHLMAVYGNKTDQLGGVVFEVSAAELTQADLYEVDDYQRILVQLASGVRAWVYVQKSTPK